jgi:hypothetical protein
MNKHAAAAENIAAKDGAATATAAVDVRAEADDDGVKVECSCGRVFNSRKGL